MERSSKIAAGVAVGLVVLAGGGVAIARVADDDEDDGPDVAITGDELAKASEAALAHTGGGRVTDTEVGDEESWYEVEVTLDDGRQVDVQLDRDFQVVGQEADEESGTDDD